VASNVFRHLSRRLGAFHPDHVESDLVTHFVVVIGFDLRIAGESLVTVVWSTFVKSPSDHSRLGAQNHT
jgi:hypothetical protein